MLLVYPTKTAIRTHLCSERDYLIALLGMQTPPASQKENLKNSPPEVGSGKGGDDHEEAPEEVEKEGKDEVEVDQEKD